MAADDESTATGYATAADVEVDFGTIPADQAGRVETLLARAEAQVHGVVGDLDARVADGRIDRALLVQVLSEMVAGVLRNPEGYRSMTRSATRGPFSEASSGTYATDSGSGRLELTRRHRRLLGVPIRAQSVPLADPALVHPVVSPDDDRYRGEGYVWPEPGLPTP